MCFMISITLYCQQELVKIILFAGSEEPNDIIILNNNKIEPYDNSHLLHYVGQRGFLLIHACKIVSDPPQLWLLSSKDAHIKHSKQASVRCFAKKYFELGAKDMFCDFS